VLSYTLFPAIALHGYFLFTPAMYLLLGQALSKMKRAYQFYSLCLLLSVCVFLVIMLFRDNSISIQKAVNFLRNNYQTGDVMLFGDITPMAQFMVLFPTNDHYLLYPNPSISEVSAQSIGLQPYIPKPAARIWFIYDHATYHRTQLEAEVIKFSNSYPKSEHRQYNTVHVYFFSGQNHERY
jgi:hypothetical protein